MIRRNSLSAEATDVKVFPYTINLCLSSCSRTGPDNPMAHFYRSCLRLRQLCVGKLDLVLKKLGISKAQYYSQAGQYRVRFQSELRAWGTDLDEWGVGLVLIASVNGLSDPPGDASTDTIRADVSCVICRSARFCGGVSYEPVKQAVLEEVATSRIFMPCPGKYQSEKLAGTNKDRVVNTPPFAQTGR